jgi:4-aminobutyrate aminotransferase-like enzyme
MAERLHQAGLLTIPSGGQVLRILPALNLSAGEAAEGIDILRRVVGQVA